MNAPALIRWAGTGPGLDAAGLAELRDEVAADTLATRLGAIAGELRGTRTVVVRLAAPSARELQAVLDTAGALHDPGQPRLCVAIDAAWAGATRFSSAGDDVGFMLDRVDASTPLRAIASEGVELIRIDSAFCREARGDLRSDCILDALLRFARDMGIATVGSAPRIGGECLSASLDFDYVPDATALALPTGSAFPRSRSSREGAAASGRSRSSA